MVHHTRINNTACTKPNHMLIRMNASVGPYKNKLLNSCNNPL